MSDIYFRGKFTIVLILQNFLSSNLCFFLVKCNGGEVCIINTTFKIADTVAYLIDSINRDELESIILGYSSLLNVDQDELDAIKDVLLETIL